MATDINDFITLDAFKNGRVKISQTESQEANIYKLLRDFGYGMTKIDNKRIYFKREGTSISSVHPSNFRQAFFKFLVHEADFSNIPDETNKEEIINWFYKKNRVKQNGLYDHYLTDILSDIEVSTLRMSIDPNYKHTVEINQLLSKFEEWRFKKTVDKINSYGGNPTLYYKKISDKKFLVFSHWHYNSKSRDGFDSWIATYLNENQIGTKKPVELLDIRSGFRLDRDFPLIKEYLNSKGHGMTRERRTADNSTLM
mgnify:CR=1 FL=1